MPFFQFQEKEVYYEAHGTGTPILLLNGIMMSTPSWLPLLPALSQNNRLLLLDFLDQGQSAYMTQSYDQSLQAEVAIALLDHLGLEKVRLAGISYGGEVAQIIATQYPTRVERLALFNTTARTGTWLGDIGDGWNLASHDPLQYYLTTIPVIYSPDFYRSHHDWMEARKVYLVEKVFSQKGFIQAMKRLTNSASGLDLQASLADILAPTLIVSGAEDYLTPVKEQTLMASLIPHSHHVILPNCGHASMYEQPNLFVSLLLGFLNAVDVTVISD